MDKVWRRRKKKKNNRMNAIVPLSWLCTNTRNGLNCYDPDILGSPCHSRVCETSKLTMSYKRWSGSPRMVGHSCVNTAAIIERENGGMRVGRGNHWDNMDANGWDSIEWVQRLLLSTIVTTTTTTSRLPPWSPYCSKPCATPMRFLP